MVGEFVCMYVCSCTVSEWVSEWVWVSVEWVWVSVSVECWVLSVECWVSESVSVSEFEWVSVSECGWVWVSVCEWVWVSVSECEWVWVSVSEWVWMSVSECEWVWVSVCEWVCVSECVWVSVSECEWVWVSVSECVWVSVCEWVWVSECEWVSVCEWVWVSECVWVSEWVSELSEWVSESVSEWVSEWVREWVSEWVNEWVSKWVSEWVSAPCPTPATQKRRRPRDTVGTPGRTADPLAVHVVPRLPRKSGGDQGTPEGRQGVHPTPWQCTLSHTCHAKAAETKGHRRDARAYIRPLGSAPCPTPATQKRRRPRDTGGTPGRTSDPFAVHLVPCLPRKSGGDQGTPEGRQGVHPTPWQCTLSHACHAKAAETKGHRRDAKAYIRPLGSAPCPTPATQKRRRPRDTGGTPRRTSDPLAVHLVPRLPRKSGGDQGTPEGRQGVHPTPWQCTLSHACHAKAAETKGHRRDARAYIRPLGSARCPTPATQKRRRPRDTGGTPGRTSDPLAVHVVPRLPRKSGGDQGTPEGRQGVHPTPWQCTLSHACHAKAAETKGHRRDAKAYIRPLGSARCPTPATQKRRRPRDTGGTPGRTSDPLAVHVVPRLPRKSGGDQGTPEGRQGVHPTP